MINEAALAMEYGASCEDIARVCHAHPVSVSEYSLMDYFLCSYVLVIKGSTYSADFVTRIVLHALCLITLCARRSHIRIEFVLH